MTQTHTRPERNGVDVAMLFATLDAVKGAPEHRQRQLVAEPAIVRQRDRRLDAVEHVAAHLWDLPGIRGLLRAMASAMTDEIDLLETLPAAA